MRVMCLGDSNTYGFDPRSYFGGQYPPEARWVDLLTQRSGWEVLNEGENGRSIPQWSFELEMLQRTTIDESIDLLIVMLGSNDLLQGADAALTAKRMEAFLSWLPVPRSRVLLVAPPPMQPGAWVFEERLLVESAKLADEYRSLAEKMDLTFADSGKWGITLTFDGAHFTEEGHKTFAENLYQTLHCKD
ncbi:MAG: lipase [Ruminiclostridium sp.]|nr:lipase [Ruminiclostridium sp.]